ncbi:MAG: hypothetical protein ACKOXB_04705 [Flavobacteriales bacterium]
MLSFKNISIALGIFLVLLFSADYYLHYRLPQAFNTEGYRGEILGDKEGNEYRIACFGGSTTFGYLLNKDESYPFYLQHELAEKGNFTVANLGANGQGIYGISHDVEYYDYLQYDAAILYDGYNDRNPKDFNLSNFRGGDLLFSAFGYKTILWFYLKDKYTLWNTPENIVSKPVFDKRNPNSVALKNTLSKYFTENDSLAQTLYLNNKKPYGEYLNYLEQTLTYLSTNNIKTFYVCQPKSYNSIQQKLVRQLIAQKFKGKVKYISLSDAIENMDDFSFDSMHLTAEGNRKIAKMMKDSVLSYLK